MNKKLKVTHKFLDNVACNYLEKKTTYIEENLKNFVKEKA